MNSDQINKRFHQIVPGGSHTYSKGDDQFPANAPKIMSHAKGAECWDIEGKRFIDWAMGNRVMILGHAFDEVDDQVCAAIRKGTNFTRPGILEYELAEYLVGLWPCAEMVKFGKNGSDVTTAAVKLSRAYTGRKYVLVCSSHPFFAIHDWFIGSTEMNSGTLDTERQYTLKFKYNDIESVEQAFDQYPGQIAAVILEPVKNDSPYAEPRDSDYTVEGISRNGDNNTNFLKYLREKTEATGTVLIFDENIAGMRFDIRGSHHRYGIYPDLAAFGKAIANGYSCSVLAGKRELMELGGIHHDKERVFLLSQTHGSETVGLSATLATLKACDRLNVTSHVWSLGGRMKARVKDAISKNSLNDHVKIIGFDANPQILCTKANGDFWPELHTLFHQYMVDKGILIPWISITHSHNDEHLNYTVEAIEETGAKLRSVISNDAVSKELIGDAVKPVFRKWNN
ncbi:glutamate-1-semialdehyde 2,1-aminomutase [Ferrigenium kumadai]|uniref:Glutamate-1-semialdehyde 2,1-aminomutase n=1 Tax=Ferrigenium kumadai TaxID=1682490 RepID=A0AAN1T1A0_9PROT|nr:glutamate-1-semialdehyde 2,1-aminomutase [Ferrigenium kumadai]BBJ00658.1 glutamate-1-semialdehyde 2,1-aminomutase [Ferrigenium kumadai]